MEGEGGGGKNDKTPWVMSNAASDISVRERDTSRRFKKGRTRRVRRKKKETEWKREREPYKSSFIPRKKSSLLVRRKKLRLKILSWGRGTLSASARKGGGGRLPQGKVEYEANAANEERLKHSHQFLSSPLITDVASSSMLIPVKQFVFDDMIHFYTAAFLQKVHLYTQRNQIIVLKIFQEFICY